MARNPTTSNEGEPLEARPESALNAAIRAAALREPVIEGPHGARKLLVPDGFRVEDFRDPHAFPPYAIGKITVDDAESLIRYVNRFQDARSILVADYDHLAVDAVLDYHAANDEDMPLHPGPGRHVATLALRESEEFKRWAEMEGALHDQMAFAEFLDENANDISDPEPADFIEIARELEATQGVNFKSSTRLQTGERSLVYETETQVRGEMKVPTTFTLAIPLFQGEEPSPIQASFRFRPSPQGLKLGFVWRRVEYRRQAQFSLIAHRVSEATGRPVMFGRRVS